MVLGAHHGSINKQTNDINMMYKHTKVWSSRYFIANSQHKSILETITVGTRGKCIKDNRWPTCRNTYQRQHVAKELILWLGVPSDMDVLGHRTIKPCPPPSFSSKCHCFSQLKTIALHHITHTHSNDQHCLFNKKTITQPTIKVIIVRIPQDCSRPEVYQFQLSGFHVH